MRFLEVNFYDKADTYDTYSVSVVIQWREQASRKEEIPLIATLNVGKKSSQAADVVNHSKLESSQPHRPTIHSNYRLRPTDKLVLNALRTRLIPGQQITKLVRLQELINECAISRRQVQICLRRLTERGLVSRLPNETNLDNQEGFAYRISKDMPYEKT